MNVYKGQVIDHIIKIHLKFLQSTITIFFSITEKTDIAWPHCTLAISDNHEQVEFSNDVNYVHTFNFLQSVTCILSHNHCLKKYKMRSLHNFNPFHGTNRPKEKCSSKSQILFQCMLSIKQLYKTYKSLFYPYWQEYMG